MERALSANFPLFLILVVMAAFIGLLIYLGRLKRPTVLDVCRFLKPVDGQMILSLGHSGSFHPTRWHYGELKETLLEIRRCFSALQFDLRLLIAWANSQLRMELVEKPWEKDRAANELSEAERLIEQEELEKFVAGNRELLAAACALQKYIFWRQMRVYLWLIFRSHWFLPFPIPNVANLTFETRGRRQHLFILYLNMARAAVALGELYDATGAVSGVRDCFAETFMNFKKPEAIANT